MKVKVKKLDGAATIPRFAHPNDAGADLFCLEDCVIETGRAATLRTGISIQLPDGYVALVWDKSGVSAKRRLKVMGGVVDAGYRGEIMVTLENLGNESQAFQAGDKIAQMLIQKVEQPAIVEADELDDSQRGEGAFGSTGK